MGTIQNGAGYIAAIARGVKPQHRLGKVESAQPRAGESHREDLNHVLNQKEKYHGQYANGKQDVKFASGYAN